MIKNNKISAALIGAGRWGQTLVKSSRNTDIQFDYFYDENSDIKIDNCERRPLEQILGMDSIKTIFIATPAETHYDIAKQVLEANKHCWIEKPIAWTAAQAASLYKISKDNRRELDGLVLHTDLTFCYSPEVNFIKDLLKFGTYGSPLVYKSIRSHFGPFTGTDIFRDLIVHDIAILLYLFGTPKYVLANGTAHVNKLQYPNKDRVFDDAHVTFFYGSGQDCFKCQVEVSLISPEKKREIYITTDKGFIETYFINEVWAKLRDEENFAIHETNKIGSPLEIEINHFADCIKNKKKTLTNGHFGYQVMYILEKVEESANSRREVKIP
jgi:predicted dehydrogenase